MKIKCIDCPDRQLGCHGTCNFYKEYREEREKTYALRKQLNQLNSDLFYTTNEKAYKLSKRQNKRK